MIDLAAALRSVVDALERAGIEYLIVGSTAGAAWGAVRTTRDVDIVAMLGPSEVEQVLLHLEQAGLYVPVGEARAAVSTGGSFNALHPPSGGKVDVFIADPDDAFNRSRLSRRARADVLGIQTWIATAEDVVLAKLRWRLDSRSDTQWRDCVEMVSSNRLDRDYLHRWAPVLGVSADLDDLLAVTDER